MKAILYLTLLLLMLIAGSAIGIRHKRTLAPAVIASIEKSDAALKNVNGRWQLQGEWYSGNIVDIKNNVLVEQILVHEGWEEGCVRQWYADGKRKSEEHYAAGEREGCHKGWWPNDRLRFVKHFVNDQFEGTQTTYFENGQKWSERQYKNGYEEGLQRAWNVDGRMVTNFTVKNGKLYGVIGRFDCMSVNNEKN